MHNIKEKAVRFLPWLVLFAALAYTIGIYALYGECGLDSDVSSEMVLAELLNEEGRLISPNWYYSTELRVVSPVPLYQLGLKVFPGNWHAAHTFGLAAALVMAALSVAYMGTGAGLGAGAVLCAAALTLPVSEIHRFLFSSGGFYTGYVILSCIIIGMILRMPRAKRPWTYAALLAALGFFGGLSGVRMPMILMAPLALACALEAFDALRSAPSVRALLKTQQAKLAFGVFICGAAMLGGYLVNTKVLAKTYHFWAYEDTRLGALNLPAVLTQLESIVTYFGYRADVPMLSMRGICNVMTTGVCALMALCLISGLRRRAEHTLQERMLLDFTAFAAALGVFLNIAAGDAASDYSVGYFLVGLFALVMTTFMALSRMRCAMRGVRTLSMLALAGVMSLQSLTYVLNYLPRETSVYQTAEQWLTENGYTVGCSTFWNGNVLTELSDGKIRMYTYDLWTDDILTTWLQRADHFEGMPEGEKAFACVDFMELAKGDHPFGAADPAWTNGYLSIYTYASTQELEELLVQWRTGLRSAAAL